MSKSYNFMEQFFKPKVLVIVSCTKKKLSHNSPAIELYQGDIFKNTKKWVQTHFFDLLIISAKHGIVKPDDLLDPYDLKLKNLTEARRLQKFVIPVLEKDLTKYNLVVLILGNLYLEVISPIISNYPMISFYRLKSENGIFDYKKNIRKLLQNDFDVLNKIFGPDFPLEKLIEPEAHLLKKGKIKSKIS